MLFVYVKKEVSNILPFEIFLTLNISIDIG